MLASKGEEQSGWVRWGGRRWDGGGQRCWKRRRLKGVEGAFDGGRGCVVKRGRNHLSSDK